MPKTHCIHGHPFEGENLYVNPKTGARICKTCRRAAQARWVENHRAEWRAYMRAKQRVRRAKLKKGIASLP